MFLKIFFELLLNQPLRNLFTWMPAAWDICCSCKRSLLCFCRLKHSLLVHNSPVLQLSSPEISPSCSSRSSSLCRCMEVINEFHLEDEHSAEAELFSLNIGVANVAFSRSSDLHRDKALHYSCIPLCQAFNSLFDLQDLNK